MRVESGEKSDTFHGIMIFHQEGKGRTGSLKKYVTRLRRKGV